MKTANDALASLHAFSRKNFSGDWCKDWHDITADWLDTHIDKRLDTLGTLPFTSDMVSRITDEWEEKRTTARNWVSSLQAVRDLESTGAVIKQEQDTLICTNKQELAERNATNPVDDVCKEYWRLVQNVREAFLKLQIHCSKHDLKEPIPNDIMKKSDIKNFLNCWNFGLFHKNPTKKQEDAYFKEFMKHQL